MVPPRVDAWLLGSCLAAIAAVGCDPAPGATKPEPTSSAAAPASAAPHASAVASASASAAREHAGPPHWGYAGPEDPAHWGDLSPEFALCKTGTAQTPIDLPKVGEKNAKLQPLAMTYKPFPLSLTNNGHTVVVNAESGSSITMGGERYELAQFHFHSPSEHTLAGKSFPLEMHLVHRNANGKLLVVGLFFDKGKANEALTPIWSNAPGEANKDPKVVAGVSVDLAKLVPTKTGYYHYTGSLTTPPCSEGVEWYVVSTVGTVEEAQVTKLRDLFHGPTNRPIQPLGARKVEQF